MRQELRQSPSGVILPTEYWENEFKYGWKNGESPNYHFLKFLKDHEGKIGPRILDMGSGDGRHLLLMAQMGYELTGLELTDSGINTTLNRLRNNGLSARLIKGNFLDMPFEPASFDAVISTQVLHYNNWSGAMRSFLETSRVLKPGGLFFFRARSDKGHWRATDRRIFDERGITRIETRGNGKFVVMVHDYTLEELEDLAYENNLEIIGDPIDEDADGKQGQWNVTFRKL